MRKKRAPRWLVCVTVFPQFRLPQSVLDTEIARIEKMGVTIKCNNEVGNTLTLEQLKAENRAVHWSQWGYQAVQGYRC